MRNRPWVNAMMWPLALLILIATCSYGIIQKHTTDEFSPLSLGRQGLTKFVTLLEMQGYKVRIDNPSDRDVADGVIPIFYDRRSAIASRGHWRRGILLDEPSEGGQRDADLKWTYQPKATPLKAWGTFQEGMDTLWTEVSEYTNDTNVPDLSVADATTPAGAPVSIAAIHESGNTLTLAVNGSILANEALAVSDNSYIALKTIGMIAPPGSELAFCTTVEESSLFEAIGKWAVAGWRQFLLLCFAIVFTLGKRFGLATDPRQVERGSRDLVDSFSNLLDRGGRNVYVLNVERKRAEYEIKRRLRLDPGLSRQQLMRFLSPELQQALIDVDAAASSEIMPPGASADLLARLWKEIESLPAYRRRVNKTASSGSRMKLNG
ncbi:MAG: hypothetical protein JSS72_09635 [Armatimonadetes bacterium]|nr:hypothetical protein [Armatimonadota bacterium]